MVVSCSSVDVVGVLRVIVFVPDRTDVFMVVVVTPAVFAHRCMVAMIILL